MEELLSKREPLHGSPKRKRGEPPPKSFSPIIQSSPRRRKGAPDIYPLLEASARGEESRHHRNKECDFDSCSEDDIGHTPKRLAQMTIKEAELGEETLPEDREGLDSSRAIQTSLVSEQIQRTQSPPLNGELSDAFWHESEITGHIATDPNDDGYGINGIGFIPTPAIAWARSQKRKQQVADYKSREAREARQRRFERRTIPTTEASVEQKSEVVEKRRSRVRFDNG